MPQPTTPDHLLNTSWTLHRLSPLHHGKEFQTLLDNSTALNTYATRLRDQLTGDVLAGLQATPALAGDDEGLSKTGALKACTWESINMSLSEDDEDDGIPGILITLGYENAVYKAVLLPGLRPALENATSLTSTTEREGSTHLPLLMTRLPTALRQTVISFLSANFDVYCSAFRLPANFMCAGLDVYVGAFLSSEYGDDGTLEDVVKDMHLTLSFSPSIAPALRSLNITIPHATFGEFLRSSPTSSPANSSGNPFLSNLSAYIEKHLSMKLDLDVSSNAQQSPAKQHVRLSKIACGGFVLGSEGRMKLVALSEKKSATGGGDEDGGEAYVRTEREKLELRGSQALLGTVMRRVVAGEGQIR